MSAERATVVSITTSGRIVRGRAVAAAVRTLIALIIILGACAASSAQEAQDLPDVSTPSAYIRVNQVGYELGTLSRAYLMSSRAATEATFTVVNSKGVIAYSSPVGAKLGRWGQYNVYALDFSVATRGTYTLSVNSFELVTSDPFPIDTPEKIYSEPIAHAKYFYENERDGADFIKTALRTAPGHLNDAKAAVYENPQFDDNDFIVGDLVPTGQVIDAEGGWWDAGDYLKFVQTTSYAVAIMLIGVRDFPDQLGAGPRASNFTNETEFGVRFLQKMWDDDTKTLFFQVGIGTDFEDDSNILSDHDLWRLPQKDDTFGGTNSAFQYIRRRPVFAAGAAGSKISPNLAGRLAADFAECYQVFQSTNAKLASSCLLSAEHIFDLADTHPGGNLLTTAPFDFYPETAWRDDLELGATEIYFALESAKESPPSGLPHTDPQFYLKAAARWAHAYINGPDDGTDTLNLYDVSGLAHFELYRAIGIAGNPGGLAVTQADLLSDLKKQLDNEAIAQADVDPFGFGFPWNSYDTAAHGAGLSVMAAEYYYLTGDASYDSYSKRWLGNILGANAWGVSFIVGDGTTFTDCMQHQVANIKGSLEGQPPVLYGALVEGPNSAASSGFLTGMRTCPPGGGDEYKKFNAGGAVFKDNVQSYTTTEPAIDLTSLSYLMFAWRVAGEPSGLKVN